MLPGASRGMVVNYLLVGNADIGDEALMRLGDWADVIVQMNKCRHLDRLPAEKTRHVVVTNTGVPTRSIVGFFVTVVRKKIPRDTDLLFTRNEQFYAEKMERLRLAESAWFPKFECTFKKELVVGKVPTAEVDYDFTEALEGRMRAAGMRDWQMPSTGMVAFEWFNARRAPGDEVKLIGFTHEGWGGHPWAVEKKLLAPHMAQDASVD